jgi:hypothetical protein
VPLAAARASQRNMFFISMSLRGEKEFFLSLLMACAQGATDAKSTGNYIHLESCSCPWLRSGS